MLANVMSNQTELRPVVYLRNVAVAWLLFLWFCLADNAYNKTTELGWGDL